MSMNIVIAEDIITPEMIGRLFAYKYASEKVAEIQVQVDQLYLQLDKISKRHAQLVIEREDARRQLDFVQGRLLADGVKLVASEPPGVEELPDLEALPQLIEALPPAVEAGQGVPDEASELRPEVKPRRRPGPKPRDPNARSSEASSKPEPRGRPGPKPKPKPAPEIPGLASAGNGGAGLGHSPFPVAPMKN